MLLSCVLLNRSVACIVPLAQNHDKNLHPCKQKQTVAVWVLTSKALCSWWNHLESSDNHFVVWALIRCDYLLVLMMWLQSLQLSKLRYIYPPLLVNIKLVHPLLQYMVSAWNRCYLCTPSSALTSTAMYCKSNCLVCFFLSKVIVWFDVMLQCTCRHLAASEVLILGFSSGPS